MADDPRTFIQVQDGLPDHPKLAEIDDDVAAWLLVALWCYCSRYLTDGRIPKPLAHRMTKGATKARCEKLVKAGLLHDRGAEYEAHDYLKHQRSAGQVAAARERNAANGRGGGLAKAKRAASQSLSESLAETKRAASDSSSETPSHAVAEVRGQRSEFRELPPPVGASAAPDATDAGAVIGAWVTSRADNSQPKPAAAKRGAVGAEAKRLHDEGHPWPQLTEAATAMGTGPWDDLRKQVGILVASTRPAPRRGRPSASDVLDTVEAGDLAHAGGTVIDHDPTPRLETP